jgi:hypothetical protein
LYECFSERMDAEKSLRMALPKTIPVFVMEIASTALAAALVASPTLFHLHILGRICGQRVLCLSFRAQASGFALHRFLGD